MTVEELYGQMVDTFQRETGLALAGDGDMAVRLYAVAAQLYALYVQADWVGRQCVPQTAQGDYLDKHAQLRGLERRAATAAVGVLSFETDHPPEADLSIPEGTVCMTAAQVRFETTEAGVLKAGQTSAQVRARAVEPGAAGNAAAGTVRAMAVAPVGVSRCTNPEAFSGGLDAEGDESLRERVLETFRRMPNGANAAFYQQEALSFPEVAAATVVARPRGVGTVDVFLATAAGLPDSGLLEQVAAHLEERREIAVDVQVKAPEVRTVDVSVQVAARPGADFDTVRQAVESAVRGRGELRPHRPGGRCGGSGGRAATTGHTDGSGTGGDGMSYGAYLRELLRPLRIYGLEGTANGGELEAQGKALDGVEAAMEEVQREMLICTAEGRGLEAVEALLARKPVAASLERRRAALAALLRIGGDSFTLTAINDNLKGCGLNAVASETETPGVVEVRFPDVPGIPDGFESMRAILEDILPCHLDIRYVYWYITWALMEERFATWGDIEKLGPTWEELEKMVRD